MIMGRVTKLIFLPLENDSNSPLKAEEICFMRSDRLMFLCIGYFQSFQRHLHRAHCFFGNF